LFSNRGLFVPLDIQAVKQAQALPSVRGSNQSDSTYISKIRQYHEAKVSARNIKTINAALED